MEDSFATSWIPSERLRQWALWGALAAGVDVALLCSGVAADILQPQVVGGVSLSDILDALVIVPELLIVLALVAVAREVRNLGLWRSSIGFFGCSWLFLPLLFLNDDADGMRALVVGLVVLVGTIVLLVVVTRTPRVFSEPEPAPPGSDLAGDRNDWPPRRDERWAPHEEEKDEDVSKPKESPAPSDQSATGEAAGRAWGCGTTLAVLALVRLLTRGLRNAKIEWEILVPMAGFGLLLVCAAVFSVWFGLAKIRSRGKLGTMAVVSGGADLLFVFGMLAAITLGLATVLPRVLDGEVIDEDDAAMTLAVRAVTLLEIVAKLMTGLLLVAVWRREEDPWDAELSRSRRNV